MSKFKKNKKMPDLTAMQTDELLNEFDQYAQQGEVAAIIAELKDRIIKNGDPDDLQVNGQQTTERGLRPLHAPRV